MTAEHPGRAAAGVPLDLSGQPPPLYAPAEPGVGVEHHVKAKIFGTSRRLHNYTFWLLFRA